MVILSTLESTSFDKTIRRASKWLTKKKKKKKTQNLELLNLKCATYAQLIRLSL